MRCFSPMHQNAVFGGRDPAGSIILNNPVGDKHDSTFPRSPCERPRGMLGLMPGDHSDASS